MPNAFKMWLFGSNAVSSQRERSPKTVSKHVVTRQGKNNKVANLMKKWYDRNNVGPLHCHM